METTLEVAATKNQAQECEPEINRRARRAAASFLKRRDFEILEHDWFCPAGSVDLVCMDDETLVFIEVKARSDASQGFPSDKVDQKKRERFERIAASYLQQHTLTDTRVRFDVVSILVLGEDRAFLRHHVNAFGCM